VSVSSPTPLQLVHGDDPEALGALSSGVDVVLDANSCTGAEVLDRSSGGLFGDVSVLVLNAQSMDVSFIPRLAGRPVTLRVDNKAPAALVRAVQGAGGAVRYLVLPRDVGAAGDEAARRFNVHLTAPGRRALVRCCAGDVLLARSVIRACAIAEVREVGPQQVERLTGGSEGSGQLRDLTRAIRSGRPAAAAAALGRCTADPHAVVAAVRRELAGLDEVPAECGRLIALAEDRLRSTGRPAALWAMVPQVAAELSSAR
jgi:hypothetical protein